MSVELPYGVGFSLGFWILLDLLCGLRMDSSKSLSGVRFDLAFFEGFAWGLILN